MIRVAFTTEQNWNGVPGGTARSTNRLVDSLAAFRFADAVGIRGVHRATPTLALPTSIDDRVVPISGRVITQLWNRTRRPKVNSWTYDCDVMHGSAYLLPRSSLPEVVTLHDLAFLHEPAWFTDHGRRFLTRFLDDVRSRDVAVIAPSAATKSDCVQAGIPADRVTVIPWGVAGSVTTDVAARAIADRHGLPERYVLFVGTREPRKNLPLLADAMQGVADAPLVCVGPDGWGDVPLPGVKVLGEVPSADLRGLIRGAAVLAYPSLLEGFGLPVLEAMAEGTPVLVTEGTAPADVALDGGLAVDTSSSKPIREAIEWLLADDSLRARLGAAGERRAGEFTWERTARQTLNVYESLL